MTAPRALVVDDNAMTLELVSFVLAADRFVVQTAADAAAALAWIPLFRPDVILMDVQMPGIDGLALTRTLKADPATRHIVIVAMTACAMNGDEGRMRDAGCDGYISKPIEVATFCSKVRSCM